LCHLLLHHTRSPSSSSSPTMSHITSPQSQTTGCARIRCRPCGRYHQRPVVSSLQHQR
jgi:hypothetical protein